MSEQKVTDEELSNALEEENQEPVNEEVQQVEEEPKQADQKKDVENAERSALGRKFKNLESRMDQMLGLMETRQQQSTPPHKEEEEIDIITSRSDVESVIEARERKKKEEQEKYESGYLRHIGKMGASAEDPDWYDLVMEEMMTNANFRKRYSNDPSNDAELNYTKAENSLLRKAKGKKEPNVKGESPRSPLGGEMGGRASETVIKMPKLDAAAQDYVDYLRKEGKSEEDIAKMLQ